MTFAVAAFCLDKACIELCRSFCILDAFHNLNVLTVIFLVNQTYGAFQQLIVVIGSHQKNFYCWICQCTMKMQNMLFCSVLMTIQTDQATLSFLPSFCTIIFHDQVSYDLQRDDFLFLKCSSILSIKKKVSTLTSDKSFYILKW
jgi:hypothetical protein